MQDKASWTDLYRRAVGQVPAVSGIYHDNYLVRRDGTSYVIRVNRKLEEPDVEPRMYAEASVLAALAPVDIAVPELFHDSGEHEFMVISYLPGRRIADIYPPGTSVPDSLIEFIRTTMSELYRVEREALGAVLRESPWRWVSGNDAFLPDLLSWLTKVYDSSSVEEKECMRAVGLPTDLFDFRNFSLDNSLRTFRLCHGDLQRENLLVASRYRYSVLDWEMAVWGDPVWDIASHMHRAAYPPDQAQSALQRLLASCPDWTASVSDYQAYDVYLKVEQYRSLILDCVRNLRIGGPWDEVTRARKVATYYRKLVAAGFEQLSETEVLGLFERCWSIRTRDRQSRER